MTMNQILQYHSVKEFTTNSEVCCPNIEISYRLFGKPLHTAPIVMINHALTGNSLVTGTQGWWSQIVCSEGVICLKKYTVIAIDIPGNGHDPQNIIKNYKDFNTLDIARLYKKTLDRLNIKRVHAIIGLSLGGGIAWELINEYPTLSNYMIGIATDWRATDWILAHCKVQEQILNNSNKPVYDARMMAMLFYRTAASFQARFNRSVNENLGIFNVESWLLNHGHKLEQRFQLPAYKMVNHLLSTLDITRNGKDFKDTVIKFKTTILQIGIDSDFFFTAQSNRETHQMLNDLGIKNTYAEIKSIHGHDGFLIEYEQLSSILKNYF